MLQTTGSFTSVSSRKVSRTGMQSRLGVELLEDRIAPAIFLWYPDDKAPNGTAGNLNWSSAFNWDIKVGGSYASQSTVTPGAGDSIEFYGPGHWFFDYRTNNDCFVDVAGVSVKNVTISNGYNKSIILSNPLTVSDGALGMAVPGSAFRGSAAGAPVAHGTLNITSGTAFSWYSGDLIDVTVNVTNGSILNVANSSTLGQRSMDGSAIVLETVSKMVWSEGNVSVTNPGANSSIVIELGSEFIIQSSGTWGMTAAPTEVTYFTVYNSGTVYVKPDAAATFNGDYLTDNYTLVESGMITLTRKAVQTGGYFELKGGGTVKVTSNPLNIEEGSLIGTGSVDGNCTLGYNPNLGVPVPSSTTASISPGAISGFGDFGIGTLSVTGNFQMFGGRMLIAIDDKGNYDSVSVQGYAALGGKLEATRYYEYLPETGVSLQIISAGSFIGSFNSVNIMHNYWISPIILENPNNTVFTGREFRTKMTTTGFSLEVFAIP